MGSTNPSKSYGGQPSIYEGTSSPVDFLSPFIYFFEKLQLRSIHLNISFRLCEQIREEPPPSYSSTMKKYGSFENPLAGSGSQSFSSRDEESASDKPQRGKALYDFTAGGDDEV